MIKKNMKKEKQKKFKSGFVRSTDESKLRFDLIPVKMLERLALHYTNGSKLYGINNWHRANTENELRRFQQSAWRHFIAWQEGKTDEDHAMALVFNVFAYEYLNKKNI